MDRWVNPQQDAHWDERSFYRKPDDPVAQAFAVPKIDWVCETLALAPPATVLDVGAGTGMFTWWWAKRGFDVIGVEPSENMRRRSPCAELLREGDAYDLPFADDTFDLVFAGNMLHHLTRPADALREMGRVSRGPVAVCEGNRNHVPMAVFGAVSSVCRGVLHYSPRTLGELARRAALEVVDLRPHGYVYENRSPRAFLPVAQRMERMLPGGAYIVMAARSLPAAGSSSKTN